LRRAASRRRCIKQGITGRRRITPMERFHTKDMGMVEKMEIMGIMGNLGLMGRQVLKT
jgi:hypothetical protein